MGKLCEIELKKLCEIDKRSSANFKHVLWTKISSVIPTYSLVASDTNVYSGSRNYIVRYYNVYRF